MATGSSVQFSSVAQSCLTPCDPMGCSTPGFPAHHQLPELAQTHVHWVGDAIQSSRPLSPPSPPSLNLSQHQGLFQWVGSLHQVAKVLELQHPSFRWTFIGCYPLGLTGLISLLSKGLSRVFSSTTIWKHQFFGAQPSFGVGNGNNSILNKIQYSCLENPMERGAWWATAHGVTKSWTQLSD